MHWTKDINSLFHLLRELAESDPDRTVSRVIQDGVPELSDHEFDGGWNGGTTYYTLGIHVPVSLFMGIEGQLEKAEQKILKRIEQLQRAESNDFITKVVIQPNSSPREKAVVAADSSFWLPGHFKLFVSHLSKDKTRAKNLKNALQKFGITAFVAHEDIEPTKQWQEEIENALFSMDALAAVLTDGFHASYWTDHEIGVALGRGILVVPIRVGLDPYGLIGKIQGIQGRDKTLGQIASSVFDTLLRNTRTQLKLVICLTEQLVMATSVEAACRRIELLNQSGEISEGALEKIREFAPKNEVLTKDSDAVKMINELLAKHGAEPLEPIHELERPVDDDIPF